MAEGEKGTRAPRRRGVGGSRTKSVAVNLAAIEAEVRGGADAGAGSVEPDATLRDRLYRRLQALSDVQIDALISSAVDAPNLTALRTLAQLAGVDLTDRAEEPEARGATIIIIEPTDEEAGRSRGDSIQAVSHAA